jgi:hypothetical protein
LASAREVWDRAVVIQADAKQLRAPAIMDGICRIMDKREAILVIAKLA